MLSFVDKGVHVTWHEKVNVGLTFGSRFFLMFTFNPTSAALVVQPLCYATQTRGCPRAGGAVFVVSKRVFLQASIFRFK